jgi:acyl dehydratase
LEVGPLTLTDFVRWAGYQENWIRIHYDRAYAVEQAGQRDVVQSGHHRTALIARMVTGWIGQRGWLRRLSVRHTGVVHPGDTLQCAGRVRDVQTAGDGRFAVEIEVWAARGDGERVSTGVALADIAI